MSWFTQMTLFGMSDSGRPITSRDPTDDFFFTQLGQIAPSGQRVTHATALQSSVVYACVKIIASAIAALPFDVFHREQNGDKQKLPNHPLFELVHHQANEEQTAQEWRETVTTHALLRGTSFSEILPGARGFADQLVALHPDVTRPIKVHDNAGRTMTMIEHTPAGEPRRQLRRDEVFVYRGLGIGHNPILGLDPITTEANAIGARLASQDYGARFFRNDARPHFVIQHPSHFKEPADREQFRESWQAAQGGANRFKTAVLEYGMEAKVLGLSNEQSQFLETQKYGDIDICRIFGVPPHKIGIMDRATFSNIEQQSIEFVTDTLMPWLVRWHQCIRRDLIMDRDVFVEHNVAALLRGDIVSRYKAYAIGRNWGWLSANDVLRFENMNAIGAEGDFYLQPLNMAEAGAPGEPSGMGKEDATATGAARSMFTAPPKNGASNGKDHHEH